MTAAQPPHAGETCNDWCGPGSHHMTPCPAAPSEPPVHPILGRPLQSLPCPTCSGPSRETVGMVCQTCGTDYAARPSADAETLLASILRKLMADRHVFLALSTHRTETGMPVQFTLDDTTVGITDAEADVVKREMGW